MFPATHRNFYLWHIIIVFVLLLADLTWTRQWQRLWNFGWRYSLLCLLLYILCAIRKFMGTYPSIWKRL